MDRERWQRVRDLFLEVCELPPDERGVRLTEACPNDPSLKAEVDALLLSHERPTGILDRDPGVASEIEGGVELIGRRFGHYRLVELIATGGMGAVYLAERDDEQFQKRVAVKVMRRGLLDEDSVQRFRVERQALALLEHRCIARLLDGGLTPEGAPYLIMEYVEGRPIDAYCDDHRLSIADRLRLFRDVCQAVDYAHRQLVVHRDLKPGNILVTEDGTPKLLDFGIAKLMMERHNFEVTEVTVEGQRPMTPEYASPEQVRGEPVRMATDVYSLGVILYQLLTGRHPYRLKTHSPEVVRRAVLETDPPLPSSAIWHTGRDGRVGGKTNHNVTPEEVSRVRGGTPRRLHKRLRGDLDNIVLMALRKEPRRRYASAADFADDIDRYLNELPVRARRDTLTYRWGKFVRRHAVGVAATMLVAVCAVVAFVGINRQALLAEHQRDDAVSARAQSEAVVAFFEDMLTSVKPARHGGDVAVRDVLNRSAKRIDSDLRAGAEVRASLRATIGRSFAAMGLYEDAEPHLRRALEERREVLDATHVDVVESLDELGSLMYAMARLDDAETLHREALASAVERFGQNHPTTVAIQINLAEVLGEHRDIPAAERLLEDVLEVRRSEVGPDHLTVAETLDRLAGIAVRRGDHQSAALYLAEALDIHRKLVPPHHPLMIESLVGLASELVHVGELEEAQALFAEAEPHVRRALEIHHSVLGDEHVMTLVLKNDFGELLFAMGDLEAAETLFRESVTGCTVQLEGDASDSERLRSNLAAAKTNLAKVLFEGGSTVEARPLLEDAVSLRRSVFGNRHTMLAGALENLAMVCSAAEDPECAASALEEAVRIRSAIQGGEHPETLHARASLKSLQSSNK